MTAIPERRGRIQTVCGVIDATALGPTLMHEHLLCDLTPPDVRARGIPDTEITLANCWEIRRQWGMQHPVDLRLEDERLAEAELADFRAAGGSGVIELTCGAIKRNPQGLRRISQATGVHIQDHFFVVIECQRPVRVCLPRGRRQLHEAQLGTQTRNVPQNGRLNTLPSPPYRTTE